MIARGRNVSRRTPTVPGADGGAWRIQADLGDELVQLIREIVRAELRQHVAASGEELLDQNTSGLGRRHHCRAWREGKLRGRKVGRRILVTRQDRDRYVELFGDGGKRTALAVADPKDIANPLDHELAALGFEPQRGTSRLTGDRGPTRTSGRRGGSHATQATPA